MKIEISNKIPDGAITVREAVFKEEQGFVNEFDDVDATAVHFLMTDDGKPVATCRVFTQGREDEYILGRLAVLKEYRGDHLGSKLLAEVDKYVRSKGGRSIRLHSQCTARKFYEANGYVAYGDVEDDEGCPHIWMKKESNMDELADIYSIKL